MTEFMTDLLITSLAMSVVIVALAGLNKVCGSSISASFKRTIWIVVLFGLLIPFRPSIPMPFEPIAIPMPFESETESKTAEFFTEANIEGEAAFESNASVSRPSPDAVQSPPFIESRSIPYGFVLFAVWCVIAIGIFGFHLWSYKRFLSSIRRWSGDTEDTHLLHILQSVQGSMKIPGKPFSVKTCSLVDSPMLIGFLHPQIILPVVHISDDELECVLRHELTHYRRRDLWVNLIILFVLSMHWFNPLVYLMAKIIRAEGEAACDAAVVAGDDINKRKQYGEAIIGFIGANNTGRPILSTYFYGGSSDMKKRLISIMDTTRKSRLTAALCAAAVLTLTVLSGTILTNTAFAAAAEAEPSQPYIGEAKAKSIALTHAGITESAATFIRAYLDYDDGRVVYDVEFYSGDTEYDYEIDAESGDIREFDRDIEYYSIPNSSRVTTDAGRYIGEAKAKSIALEAAGIAESGATFIKAYLDSDDGSVVYDVEFYSGNTEYDYEIDAVSGDIREFDEEIEYYSIPRSTSDSSASVTTDNSNYTGGANNHIGKEKAKSIALSDAGLSESRVTRMKVKLDRGHKRTVYEVEFNNGRMEYEYEIDAATGEILESDAEYDD